MYNCLFSACPANCGYCASSTECVSTGCNGGYIFNAMTKSCDRGKNYNT